MEGQASKEPLAPDLDGLLHGESQRSAAPAIVSESPLSQAALQTTEGEGLLGSGHGPPVLDQKLVPRLLELGVVTRVRSHHFPNEKPSPYSKVSDRIGTPPPQHHLHV